MTAGREEALRLDAYLEKQADRPSLLPPVDALDPELRRAVNALRAGIVRIHPSFRFVEELAVRLRREADALVTGRLTAVDTAGGDLVPFPAAEPADAGPSRDHRAILVRGAISGVSLAGVALVAWRLGRLGAPGRRSGPFGALSLPGGRA